MARDGSTTNKRESFFAETDPTAPSLNSQGGTASTGLGELVTSLVRTVVRQELAHFFDSKLRPALDLAATSNNSRSDDEYIRTDEAARRAGVTAATVREWVKAGKLRGHHAGRLLRIKVSELDLFLASGGATNVIDLDAEARRILARPRRR